MKQRFVNVQGLRALAALLVLGLHVNVLEIRFTGNPFLNAFSPIGNWGVDLFFVISGFVMITSTWNDFGTPAISWRFFLRRLTRIYPPYLVILFPIALLYIVAPTMVNDAQAIKPNVIASFLMLPQAGFGLLVVGWTLVYEMFFRGDVAGLEKKMKTLDQAKAKFVVLRVLRGIHTRYLELQPNWDAGK